MVGSSGSQISRLTTNDMKNEIPLIPVKSSQIAAIGYDAPNQILAVKFARGGIYHYRNFPADEWNKFRTAESFGSYFIKNIKPHDKGKWPFTKCDAETPPAA